MTEQDAVPDSEVTYPGAAMCDYGDCDVCEKKRRHASGANDMSDDEVCLCPFAGEDDPCPCASGNHVGCPRCPTPNG